MNRLEGKIAVVTGASKGIGAAIAEHMAAEGASVVVNYASSKAGADTVVKCITQKEGKAVAVQADVSNAEHVQRLFAETKKAFGKLDILVNNAGLYEFLPLEMITAEHFHKQFNLNVLGLLLVTQEAVKHFGSTGGSIVNIIEFQVSRFLFRSGFGIISMMWCPRKLTQDQIEERRLEGGRLLRASRLTHAEIARRLGISLRAVRQWAKQLRDHPSSGLRALRSRPRPGRPSRLSAANGTAS